jgi:hypothetical protein
MAPPKRTVARHRKLTVAADFSRVLQDAHHTVIVEKVQDLVQLVAVGGVGLQTATRNC